MNKKIDYKIKSKKKEGEGLSVEIQIEQKQFAEFRPAALKKISKDVEIKGFRKGMAPENMVLKVVGEMKVAEEQAYQIINEVLPILIEDEKIDSLTSPQISITKISPNDSFEFKSVFILMPTVELPDYKKIAKAVKKTEKAEVSEKEISDYIDYIRKNRAEGEYMKRKTSGEKVDEKEKNNLPELNDVFAKTLGNFESLDDFKKQLRQNMTEDKKIKEQNHRRTEIIEKIIESSKIDLPEILIEEEKNRMLQQFRSDIEKMGIKFEDYLKEINKTEIDLQKEWHTDAVKRAKMSLILPKISSVEKIKHDAKRLEAELKHAEEQHKDINKEHARSYFHHILTNEAVFEFLENL